MIDNKIYSIINNYDTGIVSINKVDKYGMFAFHVDDENNIILISDEEFENGIYYDYSNIKLYQCMENNECRKTSGYIRYSYTTVIKCDFNTCKEVSINECTNKNDIGIAYIDDDANFLLCVNMDGTNYQSKPVIKENKINKNYIFTRAYENSSKYYLYISNENGYIIALTTLGIFHSFNI